MNECGVTKAALTGTGRQTDLIKGRRLVLLCRGGTTQWLKDHLISTSLAKKKASPLPLVGSKTI
jgi:hypothetical protein